MPHLPYRHRAAIAELRGRLFAAEHGPGADTFAPVFEAFLDLSADRHFMKQGEPTRAERWQPVFDAAARAMSGDPGASVQLLAGLRLPDQGLTHGMLLFEGRPGSFFTFEEEGLGLMCLMHRDGRTGLVRLTTHAFEPGQAPEHLGATVPGVH
ncbi:MAG: hypothetical protein H6741_06740 [Alphaproteobacteria bacterium]|nr:hypothetical protein [Alphaproteobacteria bacterium]MCB9792409.1 hypothetical protein [Alphaproteobacteria bacterium]